MKTSNQIEYALLTDLGKMRTNNEDNYIYAFSNNIMLIGVIDGVGGYEGGEIAAEICKKSVEQDFTKTTDIHLKDTLQKLNKMAVKANNLIFSERNINEKLNRMSCVASFAILDQEKEMLHFAHVGDTRGYVFRNGDLIKFTHDHSFVGYLEESGTILEEDALSHPRRNEISKMLGEKELSETDTSYIETGSHSFYSQDIVLFCSDGLTDLVVKAEIEQILSKNVSLEEKAELLVNRANELGGKDNITVALASYHNLKASDKNSLSNYKHITVHPETETPVLRPKRKKTFLIIAVLFFLLGGAVGFLVNTKGSKFWINNFFSPNDTTISVVKDTINIQKDTIRLQRDNNIPENQQDSIINGVTNN